MLNRTGRYDLQGTFMGYREDIWWDCWGSRPIDTSNFNDDDDEDFIDTLSDEALEIFIKYIKTKYPNGYPNGAYSDANNN